MASIYYYDTPVEITNNDKDSTWNTVDVSQFVENDDAVGIIVECIATAQGMPACGCRGLNQYATTWSATIQNTGVYVTAAWFYTPGSKEVSIKQAPNTSVYIVGEFRRGVKFHLWDDVATKGIVIDPEEGAGESGMWVDHTVTLKDDDTYADVEAVIIGVECLNDTGKWGARKKGSVWSSLFDCTVSQGIHWLPVGVDENGQYQTYFNAKTVPAWQSYFEAYEIGYIKKGTYKAILDPSDQTITSFTGWKSLDLSLSPASIPSGGGIAVVWWGRDSLSSTNPFAYLRQVGGTRTFKRIPTDSSCAAQIVKLNRHQRCEVYRTNQAGGGTTDIDAYVVGYELYAPDDNSGSTLMVDSSTVEVDGHSIVIGRNN